MIQERNITKKPLIILTGPTAVGKTDLSIALGKKIGGSMISADSMQVYKKMNIGTAKITKEEMQNIPHYLIDILDPKEAFDVTLFQQKAKEAIDEIYAQGKIPVVVGGTGFYIQALLYDIQFGSAHVDSKYRDELEKIKEEKGSQYLYEMLKEADPQAAKAIHPNNVKRVIRALEYFKETNGEKISEHNAIQSEKESPYNFAYFVLTDNRDQIYDRINRRVDLMFENGLLEEMKQLVAEGYTKDLVSMQGIGYKELFPYFDGSITLEEAKNTIKLDTRHFAKRQLTWFKREHDVIWLSKENHSDQEILSEMLAILKEKCIMY